MHYKVKTGILAVLALLLVLIFMFTGVGLNWEYVLPRRALKILAIVLTGGAIAFSTLIFQTVTNNRILTPSILGLDSLYMLIQTFIIFVFGSAHITIANKNVNFIVSIILMLLFASLLYRVLFKKEGQNIYFLLLIGIIFGTFFQSISTFLQVLIDPNEFQVVQDRMFASFNNINVDILLIAIIVLLLAIAYCWRFITYLDVLSLGKEQAINLGVDHGKVTKSLLIAVAVLTAVSTALVGPITFLGLLVVNVSHEFLRTHRHVYLILGSVCISIIALVGGLLIVERVFTFSTTISVIINFIGGVYFIYLLLKERKSW